MKKVYILRTYAMNGTVTMANTFDVFESRELAEKCKTAVEKVNAKNNGPGWQIYSEIEETNMLETEKECQILNGEQ